TVDGVRRVRPRQRAAGRALSGTTGSVTGPRLGRGRVGFDSPVPDSWGCSSGGRASVRQTEGRGSTPRDSTMLLKLSRQSAGVKYRRLSVRSGRGAPWRVRLSDRPPGSQSGKTGSTPVLAAMPSGCPRGHACLPAIADSPWALQLHPDEG